MPHTLFHTALYASLALCVLGLLWRSSAWFRVRVGPDARAVTLSQRLGALLRGTATALFGARVLHILGACFLDVLLLRRLFAREKPRWLGHLLILAGFTLLLLMHAFEALVTVKLFPGYESTLAPYLFLRNLFGAMVVAGIALLYFERWRRRTGLVSVRRPMAAAFAVLLGFVLATGYLLEAHKIASPQAFYRMAKRYSGTTDPGELMPLRAVWASEFGVAFDDLKEPFASNVMERGRQMHDADCAGCHAKPASAFVSYPVSRLLAPVTALLDKGRADIWLLYLHVFACFLGLATLPFTRFFHAVAVPISLLVNASAPNRAFSAAGRASRRALALDACLRCGICDAHCSVAPLARHLGNPYLLPSHKLVATGALANGRLLRSGRESDGFRVAEGAFLCTDCGRCTNDCPAGLDLEDLWQAGRGDLAAAGLPAPAQWVRALPALAWAEALEAAAGQHTATDPDASCAPLSADRRSFSRCVQCQTCTNVCPVVAQSIAADHRVDLTPQKVMNLLRLGLRDLTLGSRMVWDCATCYQCQENCPEGLRVTDIMCELRALAAHRLGAVRSWKAPS
ncbi:MAG: 4Fe-4S ferredoxin [Rhodocyclaceae bacterium]|nr:MAG: 4Fe-4S ferredoxin [Rhodocyclaceae bacterium]